MKAATSLDLVRVRMLAGASRAEISKDLGLSLLSVNRYVCELRRRGQLPRPTRKDGTPKSRRSHRAHHKPTTDTGEPIAGVDPYLTFKAQSRAFMNALAESGESPPQSITMRRSQSRRPTWS